MHFVVKWEIDIWADSPKEAAEQAREIMHDKDSIANYFTVTGDDDSVNHFDLDFDSDRE